MELAPFPARVRSVSHALYRAVDNLGGVDFVDAADVLRELKSFWTQYGYIGNPPANLDELHKYMARSGPPYLLIDSSLSKDRYRIARYEEYADKEAPQSWSRAVYTKSQVEKGKEKVSLKRMAKLERIIEDPWSELRPPRKKSHTKPKVTPTPRSNTRVTHNSEAIKTIVEETARKHPQLIENRTPDFKSDPMNKIERLAIICGAAFVMAMTAFTVSMIKDLFVR
jgi:hypothetical protein